MRSAPSWQQLIFLLLMLLSGLENGFEKPRFLGFEKNLGF